MSGDLFAAYGLEVPRPLVRSSSWREERLFLVDPEQGDLFDAAGGGPVVLEREAGPFEVVGVLEFDEVRGTVLRVAR